jgi:thiol-disulfide isomerase/thioredoxin
MTGISISLRRLAAGAIVCAAILAGVFVFLIDRGADPEIRGATLIEAPAGSPAPAVEVGRLAPDFEVSTLDAKRLRLSELRGSAVLLNFWATWCGTCLAEMPEIDTVKTERGDDFVVLALNAGQTRLEAREFIDFLDASFVYGFDPDLRVADAYGVYGLPLSVFIDASGTVRAVVRGHVGADKLDAYVTAAIEAGPEPRFPSTITFVSTIPRERTLQVERGSENELLLSSRSLRCDASYCADLALRTLAATPGIEHIEAADEGEPRLTVRFQPEVIEEARLVELVVSLLQSLADPVYQGPVQVQLPGP